jgi:predicted lipoprotein with Yx(FWY)xxD motif
MKMRIALVTVVAVAVAAAGVAAAAAVTHQGSAATGSVNLHKTNLGKVLAGKSGKTLYLFRADKNGKSACYGKCAVNWPPLLGKPTAGTGVKAALLGTTKRRNGTKQITYAGHPLYYFKLDKAAGQTTGEGLDFFGGKWWAVNSAGRAVTHAPAAGGTTSTPTTTTSPYPGY